MSLDRRLITAERVAARRPPRATPADLPDLTAAERAELVRIEGRYGPEARHPDGRLDPARVSDADVETVARIAERLKQGDHA